MKAIIILVLALATIIIFFSWVGQRVISREGCCQPEHRGLEDSPGHGKISYISNEKYEGVLAQDGNMNTSDLPPLNYFQSFEPAYFFYDPEVYGEGQNFSEGKKHDNPSPVYPSMHNTSVSDIFGRDNYTRYYIEDMGI